MDDLELTYSLNTFSIEEEKSTPESLIFASLAPIEDTRNTVDAIIESEHTEGEFVVGEVTLNFPITLYTSKSLTTHLKNFKSVSDDDEVLKKHFENGGALPKCKVGAQVYPCFTLREFDKRQDSVVKFVYVRGEKRTEAQKHAEETSIPRFIEFLEDVSFLLGGMHIVLHEQSPSSFYEPIRDEDDTLHIFLGTTPMGPELYHNPTKLFGMNMATNGRYHACFNPSRERGVVLTDGALEVVQIVGNNIYILFNPDDRAVLGMDVVVKLFQRAVALAINWWVRRAQHYAAIVPQAEAMPEDIAAVSRAYIKTLQDANLEDIASLQLEIEKLERDHREKMRTLAQTKKAYDILFGSENGFGANSAALLVDDHARIVANALVAKVTPYGKFGFDVHTKEIIASNGERQYRIGRFVLRFNLDGTLQIWTEESFHPDSVPHPHISSWVGPCFGNVGGAINAAIAEYRYADAVEYLLTWLTEGYAPELVIYNKIEEWPLVELTESESGEDPLSELLAEMRALNLNDMELR